MHFWILLSALALGPSLWGAHTIREDDCDDAVAGFVGPAAMVGSSAALAAVKDMIQRAAPVKMGVMINGESGTGKELVARALHSMSGRRGPFQAINMGAVTPTLAESILFGSEKGSFTGSTAEKKGVFQSNEGGTLFLDEIGETPLDLQAKLLRVLDGNGFSPVGSNKTLRPDVRLVFATNRDLAEMVRAKIFREDLYFRLMTIRIQLPPLRERKEDIFELSEHIFNEVRATMDGVTKVEGIAPAAMAKLCAYDFPGNIRELRNTIARAYVLANGTQIQPEDVEFAPLLTSNATSALGRRVDDAIASGDLVEMKMAIEALEKHWVETAFKQADQNPATAAIRLEMPLSTVKKLLKKYAIEH